MKLVVPSGSVVPEGVQVSVLVSMTGVLLLVRVTVPMVGAPLATVTAVLVTAVPVPKASAGVTRQAMVLPPAKGTPSVLDSVLVVAPETTEPLTSQA